jgi:hypothetical protein
MNALLMRRDSVICLRWHNSLDLPSQGQEIMPVLKSPSAHNNTGIEASPPPPVRMTEQRRVIARWRIWWIIPTSRNLPALRRGRRQDLDFDGVRNVAVRGCRSLSGTISARAGRATSRCPTATTTT